MSAVAPPEASQASASAPKKKNNKKKKSAKDKSVGGESRSVAVNKDAAAENGEIDGENEDSGTSAMNTPNESQFPENLSSQTNGHGVPSSSNGHAIKPANSQDESQGPSLATVEAVESGNNTTSDTTNTSIRLEAMSQEREALRVEVEQLRKALEDIRGSGEDVSTMKTQHTEELSAMKEKHSEEISQINAQHTDEVAALREELEEVGSAKDQAETQYQHLLGRVNTIKASLGERLKADKQELAEAGEKIEELESQNEALQKHVQTLEDDALRLGKRAKEALQELDSSRSRHNLSQQNFVKEREDLLQQIRQVKEEAEAAKEAMGDWEVLAMEERSIREGLTERVADMEDQFSAQKEAYEAAVSDRDTQSRTIEGLQRALQEIQEARKRELRDMVESSEEQLQALKKLVQESDARAVEAESAKEGLQAELGRLAPFEKEVKEKNLLIGKLRHEAIVLNDHLTKALRFLKKAKPEDNIDRQIVTNHFLQFLALDRSDPKKFQILQLIASLLNWTDEQKEQAGLARPGTSSYSLRLPTSPFHRTPSTPSLSSEFYTDASASKESLADLWTGFLERSAEEGSAHGSRSGSVSSMPVRPDTRGGT
ncbi:Golgi matrix protein [Phlyctema vagabunda]|uniref:Golgi matrix protein n=1 Tax=Phlyctema vagabunda TaxID=108571 RepID=A0ABR4PWP8_9HELO